MNVILVTYLNTCVAIEPNLVVHTNRSMPQTTDAIMMAIVGSAFHREIYYGDQITLFATGVGQFLSASLYTGVQTAFEAQMHETFTIVDPMNPFGMPGTVPVFAEARVAFRTFEQQYLTCTRKSFPTRSNVVQPTVFSWQTEILFHLQKRSV